ncbi:MAG: hypothetical protein AB7O21_03710 [Gammaproteobacteria bacterium]
MRKTALAVITMGAASVAGATDGDGNYAVWGMGQASCHQFVKAYEAESVQDFRHYLAGYLTAYNTVSEGVYQATGRNSSTENLRHLYTYCGTHPMRSFELAIQALITESLKTGAAPGAAAEATWGRPPKGTAAQR